jgi:flagellar protein FlaG
LTDIVHIGGKTVPEPKLEVRPAGKQHITLPGTKPPSGEMGTAKPRIAQPDVPAPPKPSTMSYAEISSMLNKVNIYLDQFEIQASYTVDKATGGVQIEIVNKATGEVIRKIPPYEATTLFSDIGSATGTLLNQMA